MPPSEITAVSVVPPPTSITMLPIGSWIGSPAPIAAAIGCSMSCASAAPARRAASVTARRSTSVIAEGHADHDARPVEPADAGALEQQADHPLRHVEVGDRPLAQRTHRDDVARRSPDHLPRLVTHRQHLVGLAVQRDDRRLVQDDAPALARRRGCWQCRGRWRGREPASTPRLGRRGRPRRAAEPTPRRHLSRPHDPSRLGSQRAHLPVELVDAGLDAVGLAVAPHQHRSAEHAEPEREQEEQARCSSTRSLSVGTSTRSFRVQAPLRAAGPGLALPDRHRRLQRVDAEASGLERLVPMGS